MVSFIKSETFHCADPLVVAAFWAVSLGSNVDEHSTPQKTSVGPAGVRRLTDLGARLVREDHGRS
jgi:hypothetical protein